MITNTGISKSALSPAIENLAYTKEETDLLLAAKADTTALTDGSVTKLGTADLGTDTKPIKLVAGVPTAVTNDLVDTNSAQTIEGVKTFNSTGFTEVVVRSNRTSGNIGGLTYKDGNNNAVGQIYGRADGSVSVNLLGTSKYMEIPNQRAYNASNTSDIATIKTLDQYGPMVRTTGNQTINGHKVPEYKPNVRSYSVCNANLNTKWVRVCSYPENGNYADMHCIVRFISGHTTDTDFMFDVDIKQRCPNYTGNSAVYLVNNACVRPLAIGKVPSGNEVGVVAIYRTINGVATIEIWGKFAGNRMVATIENYHLINNLPVEPVVMDNFIHDTSAPYITWDFNTFADELPSGTLTQYLLKGKEST